MPGQFMKQENVMGFSLICRKWSCIIGIHQIAIYLVSIYKEPSFEGQYHEMSSPKIFTLHSLKLNPSVVLGVVKKWPSEYQMVTKTYLKPDRSDSSDSIDSIDRNDSSDSSDNCDQKKDHKKNYTILYQITFFPPKFVYQKTFFGHKSDIQSVSM